VVDQSEIVIGAGHNAVAAIHYNLIPGGRLDRAEVGVKPHFHHFLGFTIAVAFFEKVDIFGFGFFQAEISFFVIIL
jgi:hypothetical protein